MGTPRKPVTAPDDFSRFVDGIDYPLYVVTIAEGGERSGCLVGFTTQVSIDPPQMLVCISDKNHTHQLARHADLVAVHLLSKSQDGLAKLFGEQTGDETDKFAECSWVPGPGGVPLLTEAARHMVGRVLTRVPFADHLGLLIEPVEVRIGDAPVAYGFADAAGMVPGHGA